MKLIKLIPKCKRAQDRVAQHGEIMEFVREDEFKGEKGVLVTSLKPTSFKGTHWFGWFTRDEAETEVVENGSDL